MKLLVTGAAGMLAGAVVRSAHARGHACEAFDRAALDVTDAGAVRRAVLAARPDVVVQCAAYTAVDAAESDEARAHEVNAVATAHVAEACREAGARLVYPSTDYVFDGAASIPYSPDHPTAPANAYGRTKLAGENAARPADALIVRTSWLYGPGGRNFVRTILRRGRAGDPLRVVDDQHGAPTYTDDLAGVILELLERKASAGVYHATNTGHTTWFGLAVAALRLAGVRSTVEPVPSSAFPTPARRPPYSVLDCSATWRVAGEVPAWQDALARALPLLDAN